MKKAQNEIVIQSIAHGRRLTLQGNVEPREELDEIDKNCQTYIKDASVRYNSEQRLSPHSAGSSFQNLIKITLIPPSPINYIKEPIIYYSVCGPCSTISLLRFSPKYNQQLLPLYCPHWEVGIFNAHWGSKTNQLSIHMQNGFERKWTLILWLFSNLYSKWELARIIYKLLWITYIFLFSSSGIKRRTVYYKRTWLQIFWTPNVIDYSYV